MLSIEQVGDGTLIQLLVGGEHEVGLGLGSDLEDELGQRKLEMGTLPHLGQARLCLIVQTTQHFLAVSKHSLWIFMVFKLLKCIESLFLQLS